MENEEFLGDQTLQQDPLYSIKGYIIRGFRPGLWLALNLGYGKGGEWKVNSVPLGNDQRNTRFGMTLSVPLKRQKSIKINYTTGVTTRIGADFDALTIVYQYTWMGRGKGGS